MYSKHGRPAATKASDLSPRAKMGKLDKTLDDELIVEMVRYFKEEAENSSQYLEFSREYLTGWQFYHGKQWLDDDLEAVMTDPDKSLLNRDVCFRTIRRINPLMSDARPVRYVRADKPDRFYEEMAIRQELGLLQGGEDQPTIQKDQDIADDLTSKWRALEQRNMEEAKLAMRLANMTIGGISWALPYWHRSHRDEPGELRIKNIRDSRDVLIDPYSEEFDHSDARYFVLREYWDADILQRMFRVSDADMDEITGFLMKENASKSSLSRYQQLQFDDIFRHEPEQRTNFRPRVEVLRCWYWGQLPGELYDEGPSKQVENPRGRVFLVAGDKVLRKPEGNPFWHGLFPYVPYRDNPDPTSPYGFGEIKWLKHDQLALNILINQILLNAVMMGSTGILAEEGAFKTTPTNRPGEIKYIQKGMLDRVKILEGANIPGSIMGLVGMFDQHAAERVNETLQGLPPGAQSSGVAISTLQDMALSMVREKARYLEWSYQRQGIMEVSLIQQFGSAYIAEEMLGKGMFDLGEWETWYPRMRNLLFSISVESKAELPMNILDRMKVALQMRQMGQFDELEFFEFTKVPVSRRLKEQLELANQMEREAAEYQLAQLRAARAQLEQQMAGGQSQGFGGGMMTQGSQGANNNMPELSGTEGAATIGYPAQSGVVAESQPALRAGV